MNEDTADSSEFLPVAEAADTTGTPPRSIYRWIKARAVPSRREGDVVLVDVGSVRRRAERRSAKSPVPAGASAGNGNGNVSPAEGDLAGRAFDLFGQGVSPIEVVQRERVAPSTVLDLYRQYSALKDAGANGKSSLASSLDELKAQFEELCTVVGDLERQLSQVWETLRDQPVPRRSRFKCPSCQTTGKFSTPATCIHCGFKTEWGFKP